MVWPRDPIVEGDKTNYRYFIVGALVTDAPVGNLNEKNKAGVTEWILEGEVSTMDHILQALSKRTPSRPVGEASDVLCGLDDL